MKWLRLIQLILGIASQVVPIVKAVEEAVGAGNGVQKKELVTNLALAGVGIAAPFMKEEVAQVLPGMIDSTVAVLNATGVFQTGGK